MLEKQTEKDLAQTFARMTDFIRSLGLCVNTKTKARGHQGFFLENRIDISANLSDKRKIEVLIHEFTHYIHSKIDSTVLKNHGSLESLFPNADINTIQDELIKITRYIDTNKSYKILTERREQTLSEIKNISNIIKLDYPDFKRSCPYQMFENIIKKTDAKYLLKYDLVKVKGIFLTKPKVYSVKTVDDDFPQLEKQVRNYIKLKAKQRTLRKISSRLNRLDKYYTRPSELFARFVEALFIDTNAVSEIAPYTYLVFCKELTNNRYLELANFINNFF